MMRLALLLFALSLCSCSDTKRPPKDESRLPPGERIYKGYCAGCHGPHGRGDGPAGMNNNPKPTNFVTGPWKRGDSPEAIRKSIVEGVPPFMQPLRSLSKDDLDALVEHVRKLAKDG